MQTLTALVTLFLWEIHCGRKGNHLEINGNSKFTVYEIIAQSLHVCKLQSRFHRWVKGWKGGTTVAGAGSGHKGRVGDECPEAGEGPVG